MAAALMVAARIAGPAAADDWPQWRGPRRDGISREAGLLSGWPAGGPKVAWQGAGLGTGYASVAVSRGRVFTLGKQGSDISVVALSAAHGQPVWARKIGATSRIPTSTPTVDADRVYALDPDGELVCLHFATGEILWRKSFVRDFGGRMMSGRGYGESPLIDGEKLICTPGGADAALVALDKRSGTVLWKAKLPDLGTAGRDGAGFSSVVVTEAAGVRQYVQLVGRGVVGVAADDGRFLWGYNAIANGTANIPTPVVRGDLVFAANGYNAGSVLLRLAPGGETGVAARVVYALSGSRFQNHHGGVVLVGEHLYGGHGSNNGLPTCLELETGRIAWKERGSGIGSAAVVCADGHLYFRYQNGLVALVEVSPSGYRMKGTLQVTGAGGDSWAHPVVANGRLYLREQDKLWVYHLQARSSPAAGATPPVRTPTERMPPAASAAIGALRKLGLSAAPLSSATPGRALYRHAVAARSNPATPVLLVTVPQRLLSSAGTVPSVLLGQIRKQPFPLVINLAGTRISDAGLHQLGNLERLVGLNLELCGRITDAGLDSLQGLRNLRVLVLAGTGVSAEGVRRLAPLRSLTALDLEVCEGVGDAACEALGGMPQLRALVLKKTGFEPDRISDRGLRHLARLSALEVLNLYGNRVTDAGLIHLAELRKLRELDLSLLAITDAGLAHLKSLGALYRLDLLYSEGFAGPKLTDAAADALTSLIHLRGLNLTGARLTDAGLLKLGVLKELRTLRLVRTGISEAGLRAFRVTAPSCEAMR